MHHASPASSLLWAKTAIHVISISKGIVSRTVERVLILLRVRILPKETHIDRAAIVEAHLVGLRKATHRVIRRRVIAEPLLDRPRNWHLHLLGRRRRPCGNHRGHHRLRVARSREAKTRHWVILRKSHIGCHGWSVGRISRSHHHRLRLEVVISILEHSPLVMLVHLVHHLSSLRIEHHLLRELLLLLPAQVLHLLLLPLHVSPVVLEALGLRARVHPVVLARHEDALIRKISRLQRCLLETEANDDGIEGHSKEQHSDGQRNQIGHDRLRRDAVGCKIRPRQTAETVYNGSEADNLEDCIIHEVHAGHGTPVPIEHRIFFDPVHEEAAEHRHHRNDGLQRDIKTNEHESAHRVDRVIPHLEFHPLLQHVVLFLSQRQFVL